MRSISWTSSTRFSVPLLLNDGRRFQVCLGTNWWSPRIISQTASETYSKSLSLWGFYICSFCNNDFSFHRWLSPAGLDLAEHLLTFNPALRATAVQALDASYFKQEQPPPELPTGYVYLITPAIIIFLTDLLCLYSLATLEGEWHELETKRERAKKRRRTEAPAPSGTQ